MFKKKIDIFQEKKRFFLQLSKTSLKLYLMLPYIGFNEPGSFEGKIDKFSQNFQKKIEIFRKKKQLFF